MRSCFNARLLPILALCGITVPALGQSTDRVRTVGGSGGANRLFSQ